MSTSLASRLSLPSLVMTPVCRALLVAVALLFAGVPAARAQAPVARLASPAPTDAPVHAPAVPSAPGVALRDTAATPAPKSALRAFGYSVLATAGPIAGGLVLGQNTRGPMTALVSLAAVGGGLVVGPAAGHVYAGNARQAWIGTGLRGGVLVTGAASLATLLRCTSFGTGGPSDAVCDVAGPTLLGSGLILAGSALWDLGSAPRSATRFNERHGLTARVAPVVDPAGRQYGLALRATF